MTTNWQDAYLDIARKKIGPKKYAIIFEKRSNDAWEMMVRINAILLPDVQHEGRDDETNDS